jgi:spore maturation protein SpmA
MALSRIWSAFIIIAILVAGVRMMARDEKIFTRMVVGKSSDKYDSVYYYAVGSPTNQRLSSKYGDFLKEYGYYKTDSASKASVLLTDNITSDSVNIVKAANPQVDLYTYISVQKKFVRNVDGIIETAKNAVIDIIIPLIGILALFMGFP